MNELAIFGGQKAIRFQVLEKWARPREKEKRLIGELIDKDELTGSGSGISLEFEKAFGSYIGCKHCLAFNHGTSSLGAAYFAAGVGPGDEVITPAVGYIGSFAGAMHMGARPIFCDIDPETLLISPKEIKSKISPRTKAINIIHMNGRICDLGEILKIAKEYQLPVIDDASHAHGAGWLGKKIGNSDHITCFSLQGINPTGKPVSGGEGGAACTNNSFLYQKMLIYCHLHRKKIREEIFGTPFEMLDDEVLGLKWRAHPLAMVLAKISLESLDFRNARLAENYQQTIDSLKEFDFICPPKLSENTQMGGYYGGIKIIYNPARLEQIPIELFVRCLKEEGVPIQSRTLGPHEYRRYLFAYGFDLWGRGRGPIKEAWAGLEKYAGCKAEDFPAAEAMRNRVFTLPCFIDVDPQYYRGLKIALQKLYDNRQLIHSKR